MKTIRITSALLALFVLLAAFAGCSEKPVQLNGTDSYSEDAELGEGAKTLTVKVVDAEEKTIIFTIHTDAETVGDALTEHNLIAGEESAYGLYVKVVNGVLADYDTDGAYWAFYQNGEYMLTGVDSTDFADGETYELVYTKG